MSLRGVALKAPRRGNLFCLTIKPASKGFTILLEIASPPLSRYSAARHSTIRGSQRHMLILFFQQHFDVLFRLFISSLTDMHITDMALFIDEI